MASNVLCSPFKIGLGPQTLGFIGPKSLKTPSLRKSLVVRVELEGGLREEISHVNPLLPFYLHKRVALIETSPYIRTPWSTTEDENEVKMWFDMPGLAASEIDVDVVDNLLIIKGIQGIDAFGREIGRKFDYKLQLPLNCAKEETKAVLKNGVVYIYVPKITKIEHIKFIHVPVKAI
ncbi:hypothetical protein RND81_12G096400 [Saponaria officinalis]|uniref:SHSP domain-containing protein n=1 Tax=Saponaria officinalis TaxID=3572 RepID=A0AAW1H8N2_SAPOF